MDLQWEAAREKMMKQVKFVLFLETNFVNATTRDEDFCSQENFYAEVTGLFNRFVPADALELKHLLQCFEQIKQHGFAQKETTYYAYETKTDMFATALGRPRSDFKPGGFPARDMEPERKRKRHHI